MSGAVAARLGDGRLHLQHGPIDLVIESFGGADEVASSYAQAEARFATVLQSLVDELDRLRQPVGDTFPLFAGPVARRMVAAVWPHRAVFVTPMAAVAGAVADEVMAALVARRRLDRAYVNNGGDIALHLTPGQSFRSAIVGNPDAPSVEGFSDIHFAEPVRGIATSGWRGRSQSFGIADAVTVLAETAAAADAAATLVANAVNVDHPAVDRMPAKALRDDTDLGTRMVTVAVRRLPGAAVAEALAAGEGVAVAMRRQGLIVGAMLLLQGQSRVVGNNHGEAILGVESR